jgi:hypothetical protein
MQNETRTTRHTAHYAMRVTMAAAIALGATAATLHADVTSSSIVPPPVPPKLEAPAGDVPFLIGHARGTQNYACLPSGKSYAWTLFGPQATLFDDDEQQAITHFLSANPAEDGALRATWQHSRDTSTVWAAAVATSSDPAYVAPGAIPWLLLQGLGTEDGPTGGDKLVLTDAIQRVNTQGGVAPPTGCTRASDVGRKLFVPYTADYVFYRR